MDRYLPASCRASSTARAVDHRVGRAKIDILKHTGRGLALDAAVHRAQRAVFHHADLARLDVADKFRAERIERAGLGGEHVAVVQPADAERTEAVRVTRSDQLARGHDDERIRALNHAHRVHDRLLDRAALEALVDDGVDQHLGIVGRAENAAAELDLAAQLAGVDQIAVVRHGKVALDVRDRDRLRVFARLIAGGRIADMADGHRARAYRPESPDQIPG